MKAARWPLYPARFKRKEGKLGEKDSVPESLPARLGRGTTAIKGQVYLRGDAAEYWLNSAELKRLSRKATRKIHKHHFRRYYLVKQW